MNIRLENIHADSSPANYVSFLSHSQRSHAMSCSDRDSIHSVSSVRSVMSGMSSFWSGLGLNSSKTAIKTEKAKAQFVTDVKYLYSAFTKIPCLRLRPDRKTRLIEGYEEFPFDTAVPLIAFKNVSSLEISDVDFRQFCGWDKLAERLRSLTLNRANLVELSDLLIGIVLDDMEKRRRRSSKAQITPPNSWPTCPSPRLGDQGRANPTPSSPVADDKLNASTSPKNAAIDQHMPNHAPLGQAFPTHRTSPTRFGTGSKPDRPTRHVYVNTPRIKRSGSESSNSSNSSISLFQRGSSSNLLSIGILPASKWQFLRHLSVADNALTSLPASSLTPLGTTLQSLDISSNLFTEMPDCLANLTALRALNTSNCMIESLQSMRRTSLPSITALSLRANRLFSIAGIESLSSLERLDVRENMLQDPVEVARLTTIPNVQELWVARNPFTRSHTNYRVTIFDLFRGAPNYMKDVILDTMGPSYIEKRQLRERVVVSPSDPIIATKISPFEVSAVSTPIAARNGASDIDRSLPPSSQMARRPFPPDVSQSDGTDSFDRRRKGTGRRLVDLAKIDDTATRHQATRGKYSEVPVIDTVMSLVGDALPPGSEMSPSPSVLSNSDHALAKDSRNFNLSGDIYRQKIEALKGEEGSNWLTVLNGHDWNEHEKKGDHLIRFDHSGLIRPNNPPVRTASHEMINLRET